MIVLGRLVAPYGVKGWLHLHTFGDDPESWGRMPDWWLSKDADGVDWQQYHPEAIKLHGDRWVVKSKQTALNTAVAVCLNSASRIRWVSGEACS